MMFLSLIDSDSTSLVGDLSSCFGNSRSELHGSTKQILAVEFLHRSVRLFPGFELNKAFV